jgi:regulator of replication initiation timing
LRKKAEKKSATEASTGDGNTVKTEDLSTAEQQPGQLDGMQRALDLVQARLDATMSELVDAQKRVTSLRGEKNHLQTEKDSLSKRLTQSEVEKKELLTSHTAEIEQMRTKYTAEISELQKSNQHAVNQYGHQSLEIVNVRKNLDDLREQCQGIETENSRLTDENTKLRQEVGQAQVTQVRVRELEGQLQAAGLALRQTPASVQESAVGRSRTDMDDVQNVRVAKDSAPQVAGESGDKKVKEEE